jgi:serine/threonine protein kinase
MEARGAAKPAAAGFPANMPFAIIRQHARGGLGVVSLARDINIKREVALKQILPQHVDNGVLNRRFMYEAQITGQLEHPSIVPVYCLGHDDAAHPYYVMRFVKGRTLDEIIMEHQAAPNPIVFRELLRRFIAVCQAVAYAHSRGVIHRDLKPANVMLGDYGETLVLDWGLAKDIKQGGTDPALWTEDESATRRRGDGEQGSAAGAMPQKSGASVAPGMSHVSKAGTMPPSAELTLQGQIIGTPAYMAPEQAEGRTELHGPVTDIYALGGILYKILTGQSPQAPTASTTGSSGQRKFTFVPSPPPSRVAKDVDPILDRICGRAMATDPQARFPRALELAQEIQRWLDEHPLSFKAPSIKDKVSDVLRPVLIPLLLGLIGIVAVLAILLVLHR